ncbi:MAG: hypothetical protein Q8L10_01540 [Candidatus Moranbacteria bacterium]|nr:hypothetical protein [Candidatus Moranbacteria bacterium]
MANKKINKTFLDGLRKEKKKELFLDLPLARFVSKYKTSSVLYAKDGITESFFTQDSKLYITPAEYHKIKQGGKLIRAYNRFDSALARECGEKLNVIGRRDIAYLTIKRRYSSLRNYLYDLVRGGVQGVSLARMWNLSIVGAVIFGMFTMTMIYRYLGQNVSAAIQENSSSSREQQIAIANPRADSGSNVVDFDDSKDEAVDDIDTTFVTKIMEKSAKKSSDDEFEKELREMVKGYPIEVMIPEIAKKDRIVAAFIVAIAKKESAWGKRVPVLDGQDCYNYWGYRGIRDRMGTGGHTCFDSPKDAVDTVAKRIGFLVSNKKLNTPDKMVIWKCGSNCAVTGGQAAADKWISDVAMYFNKLNKK